MTVEINGQWAHQLRYRLILKAEIPTFFGLFTKTYWLPVAFFETWEDAAGAAHNIFGCETSHYYRIHDQWTGRFV